jgi:hypothetical protein
VKAGATAGTALISDLSWSSAARHSTRTAETAGVLNSPAATAAVPARSKRKDASQRVTNRTAFVPNASPPGANA